MLAALSLLQGCTTLASRVAARTLESAILSGRDPDLVREALPAYLLLVDGLIENNPANPQLLAAGAQLSALYGSQLLDDPTRARALTSKGLAYGERAICAVHEAACGWNRLDYDSYVAALEEIRERDFEVFYAYAGSWLGHLQATGNWNAVADLPRVEALLSRLLALDETHDHGTLHTYLGVLNSLRPPALGGRPELARRHFERALELSEGRNLSAKVEYARRYARLVFDQDLHDRLLDEVESAPVEAPGLTLFNVLAKEQARELRESSAEYF
jgi:hypothetical protein